MPIYGFYDENIRQSFQLAVLEARKPRLINDTD